MVADNCPRPLWGVVKIESNGTEHWLGPSVFVSWSGTESEALAAAERATRFGPFGTEVLVTRRGR